MEVQVILHTSYQSAPLCSYFIPPPLHLKAIIKYFPFEGDFTFRLKIRASAVLGEEGNRGSVRGSSEDYLWLDLSQQLKGEDDDVILGWAYRSDVLEVQVVPIPSTGELDYEEVEVVEEEEGYYQEAMRQIVYEDRLPRTLFETTATTTSSSSANSHRGGGGGGGGGGVPSSLAKLLKQMSKVTVAAVPRSTSSSSLPTGPSTGTTTSNTDHLIDPSSSTTTTSPLSTDQALQHVKKGMTNLWKAVKTTIQSTTANTTSNTTSSGGNVAFQNPEVAGNVQALFNDLMVQFSNNNPHHLALLEDLYHNTVGLLLESVGGGGGGGGGGSEGYERISDRWKMIGFQKSDPIQDLSNTGLLCLENLLYLSITYPRQAVDMMTRHRINTNTNYPYALVGVKLTLMLIDILQLIDQKYLMSTAGYWDIFVEKVAFHELFVMSFAYLDSLWKERSAIRKQFGILINEVKIMILKVLAHNPKTMEDVRLMAQEEGMTVFW
eukprot:scaffold1945_cov181-Ochromonas_danica.AAC.22